MQEVNFEEELEQVLKKDARYHREAYYFLREALDHTQNRIGKPKKGEIRHVTGQELLEGIRQYALHQYGPMARAILNEWGVQRCEDFGEIVFNMVERKLLAKTEKDSHDDFKNGYDFMDAFCDPFRPVHKRPAPVPESKPSDA